jgi:hypothetical protein
MVGRVPLPGIYFRKGHFDDRLIDGLITVKISVVIITPLGAEEREMVFTGSDIMTAINAMLTALGAVGVTAGLQVDRVLGGDLPSVAEQRAQPAPSVALAQPE